jgi:hypothetical protein
MSAAAALTPSKVFLLPDPTLPKSYAAQSSIGTLIAWADDQSQRGEGRRQEIVSAKSEIWLPFLDTYRTMCLAPQPDFRRTLEDVRAMQLAALAP